MYIIIDTSSMVFGFDPKIRKDVFDVVLAKFPEGKILVSKGIIRELGAIAQNKGGKGAAAKTAIKALSYKKIYVDNNSDSADRWILGKSLEYPDTAVITNDTELIKKLKAKGVLAYKFTKAGVLK